MTDGKGAVGEGGDPEQVPATITNAWVKTSEIVVESYGHIAQVCESQRAMFPVIWMGLVALGAVACTLYCASLYLDSEPFLFNKGKLGPLEAKSVYVNKKCC